MKSGTPKGPLVGLKVLDIGTMIAGPMAATFLADFGADVIKVEHPVYGDPMREWAPIKENKSLWWKVIARNKKLITLNLSAEKGRDILLNLVRDTDVVVENFRPGTLEKWGLSFEELRRANPRIILVRVSGFGQDGPYSSRPGYGTVAEAMTGIPYFTGFPETPPTLPPVPLGDSIAATFAAMAAMFAVYHRDVRGTGEGQVIDVSLYEPFFRLAESMVIGYDQLGIVKKRMGNRLAEDSPRNAYGTEDGEWVTISASNDRTFERLAHAIGRPDIVRDPKFATNSSRIANADELDLIISEWFKARTLGGALEELETLDVVAGPIYNVVRIFEDPHYLARQDIISVPDEDFGDVRMQGVIPKFSHSPGEVRYAGLAKGSHNDDVYRDELGMSPDDLAVLASEKVI